VLFRNRNGFSIRLREATFQKARELWRLAFQVFLNRLSWFTYQSLPDVLVPALLGIRNLTLYSIIAKIPRALKTFQSALNGALLPAAVTLESERGLQGAPSGFVLRGARYTFLLFTPVLMATGIFANQLLTVWLGQEYSSLANPLRAFLVWQSMSLLILFCTAVLTRPEHYAQLLPANFLGNVLFLGIIFGTFKNWGLWSILWALLSSGVLTLLATIHVLHKITGFTYRAFFLEVVRGPILGVGLSMGVLFSGSRWLLESGKPALGLAVLGLALVGHGVFCIRWGLVTSDARLLATTLGRVVKTES
jgi:O-antigen/teichoic acid export membrane protein